MPERKPRVEPVQSGMQAHRFQGTGRAGLCGTWPSRCPVQCQSARPAPAPGEADALALTVLSAVLDGYSGARLERALTPGPDRVADSAGAYNGLWGRGPQLFTLDGVPAQGKTAQQVEAGAARAGRAIARDGVSEAELNRVKIPVGGQRNSTSSTRCSTRRVNSAPTGSRACRWMPASA